MTVILLCLVGLSQLLSESSCRPVIYVNFSSSLATNDSSCWTGGTLKPCLTFDLGLQGIHESGQGELIIAGPGEYHLRSNNYTDFIDTSDLTITGIVTSEHMFEKPQVVVKCSSSIGLSFVKVKGITINGIVFSGCGALRNSTSYNMNQDKPAFMQFYVSLYFLYCHDLNLTLIEVLDTPGTGVVIYNTVGSNFIQNSTLARNNFQPDSGYSGGGGLYIEFSFCDISTTKCLKDKSSNVDDEYTHNAKFEISNNYFIDNQANINTSLANSESFILPIGHYHVAFGRGGGLSVYINGKAHNNTIVIDNCVVVNNTALWGAGILVEFHDRAQNNSLEIFKSTLQRNSVYHLETNHQKTGGGGARLAIFMFNKNNSLISGNTVSFTNCTFEGNWAYAGGGLSLYTTRTSAFSQLNEFRFSKCKFLNNTARLGAGQDISLLDVAGNAGSPTVTVSSCEFHSNTVFYKYNQGLLIGVGTVYVEGVPVIFMGLSLFTKNSGSGLAVTGTHIEVRNGSVLKFVNNTGRYGGALNLLGSAYIMTYPNSSLVFIRNKAMISGGAINYYRPGMRDLVEVGDCFTRYSDILLSRDKWTSNFYFEGNLANDMPNAIYTSTILPCIHNGIQSNESIGLNETFCWNERWKYKDGNHYVECHERIKTAVSNYSIDPLYATVPGKEFPLNAMVYDAYNNDIRNTTIFHLQLMNNKSSFEKRQYINDDFISNGLVKVYGQPNITVSVQIGTFDPVSIQYTFSVELKDCPPGFHIPESKPLEGCVCAGNYSGYIRCDQEKFTSEILRSVWMGTVPHHNQLLVGGGPYVSGISDLIYVPMPASPSDLDKFFCGRTNGKGVLCGSCIDGYGASAIDLNFNECVPCPKSAAYHTWIFYFLACFVPILIFFGVVFIFSMTVTFGPLNSFIFFAQVINTVTKIDADGMIRLHGAGEQVNHFFNILYDMWNLAFFDSWLPEFCLSPSMNTLDILLLSYLRAVFPLVLLITFFFIVYLYNKGTASIVFLLRPFHRCLARFRRTANLRKSITGGIAALILIPYTKITLVSLLILTPASLQGPDGNVVDYVFYYNGDIPYRWNSFQYIIPAVVFSCTFVLIPPILFAYPTLLKVISHLSCGKLNVERFYPNPKLQAFLDEFHGCYRDGSSGGIDCRWFSSLYFILRVVLIAMYTSTETWELQYTVQILFYLSAAFLFAFIRPYRKDWINSVDMSMFLLLAAISTISFFNLMKTWIGKSPSDFAMFVQCVLVAIPLIYCVCYCSFLFLYNSKLCVCMRKKISTLTQRSKGGVRYLKHPSVNNSDSLANVAGSNVYSNPQPGFEDSSHVPDFLDFIETSKRSCSHCNHTQQARSGPWPPKANTSISDESTPLLSNEDPEDTGFSVASSRSRERNCQQKSTDSSGLVYGST